MDFRELPFKIVLMQEFSFYSHFALAPCLFENSEEKTPKNRLTETLEPHKQNIGAPKLVRRYQTHSLSPQAVVNLH